MDIKDYSSRLSDARSNFKRDIRRLKDSYNADLKNQETNHKNVEKRHYDSNTQKIQEISEDNKALVDKIDKRVALRMEETTSDYRSGLKGEQDQFNTDRNGMKKKFDERLTYLRDNYAKSKNSLERNYSQQVSDIDERAKNTRNDQARNYDKSVKDVSDTYSDKFSKYRETEDLAKKNLVRAHNSDLQNISKKGAAERNKSAIRHQEDLNILRKVTSEEKKQMKDNQSQQIKEIKSNQQLENKILNQNFTDLTNDISERNEKNGRSTARDTKELIKSKDRELSQSIYQLKREFNEKLGGGDASTKIDRTREKTEDKFEKRIHAINEGIEDNRFKNAADKERLNDENLNLMRNIKVKQRREVEGLKKGFEETHAKNASKNKRDVGAMLKNYRSEMNIMERNSEEQRISSRLKTKHLLNNQRKGFHEAITQLNEKNNKAVISIKNDTTKEKSALIEDYKVKLHNETQDIKNDLKTSFLIKEESWDKRINDQQSVIAKIQIQYEDKISRLNKKNAKELVAMREIQVQRDIEEKRGIKQIFVDKDREHSFEKKMMKGQFEKRLSDSKNAFEERSNKLVERYEGRLEREKKELTAEMRRKVGAAREDYNRLYKQSEEQKANMQFQFDSRMTQLRQANDQSLRRLTSKLRSE